MIARVSSILLLMTGLFVAAISFLAPAAVIETSQARANASSGWSWPLYEGFKAVDTPDDVHIWAVGNHGLIKYSANGGVSWATQQAPVGAYLVSVDFIDAVHGWSVGSEGIILHTSNGLTWITQTSGVTASLNDVSFVDSSFGWVVGSDSTILRTTNGGISWHQASSVPDADTSLGKVVFANRTTGWALGWGNRLWVTI